MPANLIILLALLYSLAVEWAVAILFVALGVPFHEAHQIALCTTSIITTGPNLALAVWITTR